MKNLLALPATSIVKAGLFLLPVFIWLQACSQSPNPASSQAVGSPGSQSILNDSSGVVLGESPDRAYRLFKFTRQSGDKTLSDLKLLRLNDLKETLVSTLSTEPKAYWSSDNRYLITENSQPDSMYGREVLLFDLNNFKMEKKKQGQLVNYDLLNDIVFMYNYDSTRQSIISFDSRVPEIEQRREIIAPPAGKLPSMILSPKDRRAKVKAYTTGGAAVNVAFGY